MIYLSYATGFLSGGFSETCATPSRCSYDPETNENLEFGYKADLLGNTLRFNAALYLTKYEDLQRAVVATYIAADGTAQQETVTVNTGSSKATGVDLEATWLPTEHWRIGAALNWLDHKYDSGRACRTCAASAPTRTPATSTDAVRPAVLAGEQGEADASRDFTVDGGGASRLTATLTTRPRPRPTSSTARTRRWRSTRCSTHR